MSQQTTAHCFWFSRSAPDFKWMPLVSSDGKQDSATCRASVGEKLVTVWLPQGAKIRCRIPKGKNPFAQTYRHRFGRTGDDLIEFKLAASGAA